MECSQQCLFLPHSFRTCNGPLAADIDHIGNTYLDESFPKLDRILTAKIVELPVSLDKETTAKAVLGHLKKLQQIAIANEGNRDIGGPGFDASRNYIWSMLEEHTDFEL